MKRAILLCLGISMVLYSSACDVCGCGASNYGVGILPQFHKHFVGLRFQSSRYISLPHEDEKNASPTNERFQSVQVWGRWSPHKRVQIFAFVPYKINRREADQTDIVKGIGDFAMLATYVPINTAPKEKSWKHMLQVGLGMKVPTAKWDKVVDGLMLHPNIQLGTGSYDLHANLQYTARYRQVGSNVELNYWYNGTNAQHFHFGNKATSSVKFFIWKSWKNISVLPQVGIAGESAAQDKQNMTLQTHTGGYSVLATGGVDVYYKKIGIQCQMRRPVAEQLGEGHISAKPQWLANLIYLF